MDEYYAADNSDLFGPFGAEGAEELLPLVCFRLGGEQYALDMARVHEVLRLISITRVPQMPDFVLGIVNARGNIIPVFDLRRKFALGGNTIDEKAKLIVVDTREAPVSFVADELLDNVKVERSSIAPAPAGKLRVPKECVAGISRLDERVVIILDWDKMYELAQEEIRNFVP
ncbi:MAG: purine-binding chemotaxis protein CheW [Candidatus Omnitrophica bacterium]|nr:purine-binding chemotaxis protein CheW [Candidatus Omnitrophota bacterium]